MEREGAMRRCETQKGSVLQSCGHKGAAVWLQINGGLSMEKNGSSGMSERSMEISSRLPWKEANAY